MSLPGTSFEGSAGPVRPGTCYKFTVGSAEEAAALIRERLGPDARVLTVRTVARPGLARLWSAPRLEVVAQVGPTPEQASAQAPSTPNGTEGLGVEPADDESARTEGTTARFPAARPPSLTELLRRSGLSELALGRLQEAPFWTELAAAPLHRALSRIGRHLQQEAQARRPSAPLSRAAFLGTPGCGRTTALCKWLGAEVFRRARAGHVVTAEFDRPNPPGALPVFCEALGVPVVRHPASTQPVTPGGFVYFDLPGISLGDPSANAAVRDFLFRERISERVLVLNAAYGHDSLRASYAAGRDLGATHVVFTHLDEVPRWGRLWDYLLDGSLEPLFLATGPSLTGDCEEEVFGSLVRRTLSHTASGDRGGDECAAARAVRPPRATMGALSK